MLAKRHPWPPKSVEAYAISQAMRHELKALADAVVKENGMTAEKLKQAVDELVEKIEKLNPCQKG